MANFSDKYPINAPGNYYVDTQCIDCDLCREHAPKFFGRSEDGGHSYVHTQPQTQEQIHLCEEAKDSCPVDAIGNNGVCTNDPANAPTNSGVCT